MRLLWVVVVAVVAAGASGGGVYLYTHYTTHITVTSINWQVYQNNTPGGFLFGGDRGGCVAGCPTNALVGSVWIHTFGMGYSSNLTVVNVTLAPPFQILGISPSVPREFIKGGPRAEFQVAILLPSDPGSYSVLGAIWIAWG